MLPHVLGLLFALAGEVPVGTLRVQQSERVAQRLNTSIAGGRHGALVAWEEAEADGAASHIVVRALDVTGARLGSTETLLGHGTGPHVATLGDDYYVAWDATLVRVSANGELLSTWSLGGGDAIALAASGDRLLVLFHGGALLLLDANGSILRRIQFDGATALAGSANGFLLGVLRDQSLLTAPMSRDGEVFGVNAVALVNPGLPVRLAAQGSNYVVTYGELEGRIRASLLGTIGDVQERTIVSETPFFTRALAWSGSRWTSTFLREGDVCTAAFSFASAAELTCLPRGEQQRDPVVAFDQLAWIDDYASGTDSVVAVRGSDVSRGTLLSEAAARQIEPAMAGDVVAWIERRGTRWELRYRNDGLEFVVDAAGHQREPRLARLGNQTLLVWREESTVRAMILSGLHAGPQFNLGSGSQLSVAAGASDWSVVWRSGNRVREARVMPSGNFVSNERAIGETPQVAWTGSAYSIVWSERGQVFRDGVVVANGTTPAIGCAATCTVAWYDGTAVRSTAGHHILTDPPQRLVVHGNAIYRDVSDVVGHSIIYSRATEPEDGVGSTERVFVRALTPRRRSAAR